MTVYRSNGPGWPFRPARLEAASFPALLMDNLEIMRQGDKLSIQALGVVRLDEPTIRAIANMMLGVADDIARDASVSAPKTIDAVVEDPFRE